MTPYFFFGVLRKTLIQFLDTFNDIQVARYHPNTTTVRKYVEVPIKLWSKEKAWKWLNERKDDESLPIMNVEMNSIDYASDRQTDPKFTFNTATPSAGTVTKVLSPIPYNIGLSLHIWTKYMIDADQILEQILPFFNPYIVLKINIPELSTTYEVKVVLQSAMPEIEAEMDDEDYRVIKWTLDFLVHATFFKPTESAKIIKEIFVHEYTTEAEWNNRLDNLDTDTMFTSGASASLAKRIWSYAPWYDEDGEKLYNYEEFV